jgi:serine protease Do
MEGVMRTAWCVAAVVGLVASSAYAQTPKDVYKKVGGAVVLILGSDDGKSGSGGTGSIVTSEGKVITNAHVVISEATKQPYKILYIFLKPPKITGDNAKDLTNRFKARVLAWSPAEQLDLALMQIENPPKDLSTIAFADPDKVEIGDTMVAIGHPEQGGLWTLTTGAVSTMIANFNRVKGKDVFQTEASVNRGNSGGPLLDMQGNMVGINTMIARQGAGGIAITDVNFSLKSSVAVSWMAGQGMGLAYAPKEEAPMVVAVAPQPDKPATVGAQAPSTYTKPTTATVAATPTEPATPPATPQVEEPPPATIVVAEEPPPQPEVVRNQGVKLGQLQEKQKVVAGKPLDPAKAKPTFVTEKRAYSLDDLRKQQMKELEDMMDEMSGKTRGKANNKGMGLW